jgi:Ran GTPase-activating protein (RanGAP) involved in mRNA processing and transport
MTDNKIICPVINSDISPILLENIEPIIQYLKSNQNLPDFPLIFPIGTVTDDGRLDLCKQNLGVDGAAIIVNALKNNPSVKHLLLGTNKIGNEGAKALTDVIQQNTALETLYLGCNNIESEGAIAICAALEENKDIKSLWFKRNPIGKESVPALIQLLKKNKNIRTLDLVNTCLEDGFYDLFDYLKENNSIERLYLSGNYLTPEHCAALAKTLIHNTSINALFLSVNDFGDAGVKELAQGLAQNNTLEELSLASCGINELGILELIKGLSNNKNLINLDLGFSPSTRVLKSKANQISDKAAAELVEFIELSPNLAFINLVKTNISAAFKIQFAELKNKTIFMDGFTNKNTFILHPDAKAIKSMYR